MTPIESLQDLIHLDVDAIRAYQQAIDARSRERPLAAPRVPRRPRAPRARPVLRDLAWIDQAIENRIWEQEPAATQRP